MTEKPGKRTGSDSLWRISWRKLRRNPTAVISLIGLLALIAIALSAPWLARYSPTKFDEYHLLEAPSPVHIFGTDDLGRDILSRVIWGGRESLSVSLLAVIIAISGGTLVGVVSGYTGGIFDDVVQRIVEIFLAFPTILLVLSIVAVLGPGLITVLLALGFSSIPSVSRLVRGAVLSIRNLEYIFASKALGASPAHIMFRHILPNILTPIIIYGTLGLGGAIMVTAGLSYIGLGAQPPSPEWGAMLNYGRSYLAQAWWMSAFPGLAIFLAVLFINLLGDGLRDALDPRMRGT